MILKISTLVVLWTVLAGAAAPLPLTPPPPDLTRLLPLAAAPLDKPKLDIPELALPAPPVDVPPVPPATVIVPAAERPIAFISPPSGLPCFISVSASRYLECGKDRFLKGEYEEAVNPLDSAVRGGASDQDLMTQARYWLGETYLRLGRVEQADWMFRQAASAAARNEYQVWATHASAWTALRLGDHARARDTFKKLLTTGTPATTDGWARHGLALSLYGLGSYAEARQTWADLIRRGTPAPLARDVAFWYGDTLGRAGDPAAAAVELGRFTQGGAHPLLDSGRIRLGWWALIAGKPGESVAAFQAYLATPRRATAEPARAGGTDVDWAEAGLALAQAATGNWEAARSGARGLASRRSTLALPISLRLVQSAIEAKKTAEADGIVQELLAATITAPVRAWLLLEKGDALRIEGNRDEARTQYELAQQAASGSPLAQHAALRIIRLDFEMREFAQAATGASTLLAGSPPADMKATALLLQGEAAYHAGNQAVAAAAFRRTLIEFPQQKDAPLLRLSLGWVALRQGRRDEARELFLEFARLLPEHPNAADALELAAELAAASGDVDVARREFDRLVDGYPRHPRTDFARLNRAILMLRAGQAVDAQPALTEWIARAPFPPLLGRAHAALGAAFLATNQPGEAAKHFTVAQREGMDAFATLGLGSVALAQGRWDEAERRLKEARESGTPEVTAAADYGLAGVAYQRGAVKEFAQTARDILRANPSTAMAPRLLYVLTGLAVEGKDWSNALDTAKALVTQFPDDETADDALERVGAGAAAAAVWPVTYDAYTLLRQRYPASPFVENARLPFAQAQIATGRADQARADLERLVATAPGDTQAWVLLARARELAGDRQGAFDAYARVGREGSAGEPVREAMLGQARLLVADKRWDMARGVLDRLIKSDDQALVVEAAYFLGETYRGENDQLGAAEYYMTAGYLAPESATGRRALLAAAQSFVALKQPEAAVTLYRKLLAQANVPGDVADAARQGLQALGRREGS